MTIAKVWIEDGCIACGMCEEICPEVFVVDDVCHVKLNVDFNEYASGIKAAADACPVEVIKYE